MLAGNTEHAHFQYGCGKQPRQLMLKIADLYLTLKLYSLSQVPRLSIVDVRSARPELLTNQELKQKPLLAWNGDTLKSTKILCFMQSAPFYQIWYLI